MIRATVVIAFTFLSLLLYADDNNVLILDDQGVYHNVECDMVSGKTAKIMTTDTAEYMGFAPCKKCFNGWSEELKTFILASVLLVIVFGFARLDYKH